jgi:hypothetical protein
MPSYSLQHHVSVCPQFIFSLALSFTLPELCHAQMWWTGSSATSILPNIRYLTTGIAQSVQWWGCWLDNQRGSVPFLVQRRDVPLLQTARLTAGPTLSPVHWVTGLRWPQHEAKHSPEVKNAYSYTSTLPHAFTMTLSPFSRFFKLCGRVRDFNTQSLVLWSALLAEPN